MSGYQPQYNNSNTIVKCNPLQNQTITCPEGQYALNSTTCARCSDNCKNCSNNYTCLECFQPYTKAGGYCRLNCSQIPNCGACFVNTIGMLQCSQCIYNYEIFNQTCVKKEDPVVCQPNCLSCNKTNCLMCNSSYIAKGEYCVSTRCPQRSTFDYQ